MLKGLHIRAYPVQLTEDDLERVWLQLVDDGLEEGLFHDGSVRTVGDFVAFATAPERAVYVAYCADAPAALFWLDNRQGRSARIHFAIFRAFQGQPGRIIGRYATSWLLTGKEPLDVLVGLTPETHKLAIKYVRDVGFRVIGTIPHAAQLAGGAATGAVVSYMTKEEV